MHLRGWIRLQCRPTHRHRGQRAPGGARRDAGAIRGVPGVADVAMRCHRLFPGWRVRFPQGEDLLVAIGSGKPSLSSLPNASSRQVIPSVDGSLAGQRFGQDKGQPPFALRPQTPGALRRDAPSPGFKAGCNRSPGRATLAPGDANGLLLSKEANIVRRDEVATAGERYPLVVP